MIRLLQRFNPVRRRSTFALAALTLFTTLHAGAGNAATSSADAHTEFAYIGTQQSRIVGMRFDTATGTLTPIGPVAEGPKTTWLTAYPGRAVLYGVDDDNTHEGSVTAYAVDPTTGALNRLDAVPSGGNGTTNLSLDVASGTLFAANYGSGSVSSIPVNGDGMLADAVSTVKETGSGPNRRQASAHAHNAVVDPGGHYVLVPDLGADRVFVYRFDKATHALRADATKPSAFVLPPGSGPRHLAFGHDGRFVYLITELSADLLVLHWDAARGHLALVQSLPVSRDGFQGLKSGAEVAVSPDGRFVYVEDRGENELVVYAADHATGKVTQVQRISSGGEKPWGFALQPAGRWLLVANQRSGTVTVFSVDPSTGMLADTGQSVPVPTAVSAAFVE